MSDGIFERIRADADAAFERFCENRGLTPFTKGIDKHGSYVWETGAPVKGLNRYISLGITTSSTSTGTPIYNPETPSDVIMTIIIGADDGERFSHGISEVVHLDYLLNITSNELFKRLLKSWNVALVLTREHLDERYILPRPSGQEQHITAR